jgi:hypothetical protein
MSGSGQVPSKEVQNYVAAMRKGFELNRFQYNNQEILQAENQTHNRPVNFSTIKIEIFGVIFE